MTLMLLMNLDFAGGEAAVAPTSVTGYPGWQSAVIASSIAWLAARIAVEGLVR